MALFSLIMSVIVASSTVCGHLHELDGSFLQLRRNGAWMVKFYAPWCGHCRKMEPAYKEAASRLEATEIRVGRIDATQHVDVAAHYEVRGYPTIKYIHGNRQFTHFGDRSADGIVKFAKRAHRPAVASLASVGAFMEALDDNSHDSMFLYLGDRKDPLFSVFERVADDYHVRSSFYSGETRILPSKVVAKHKLSASEPSIIVIKDNLEYKFKVSKDDQRPLNESLRAWVDAERFIAYPHVSESGVWDFSTTGKRVALFVVNRTRDLPQDEENFKTIGRKLAVKYRADFHALYHFGWMDDISVASSLTMTMRLPTPNLVVLHPPSEKFYLRHNYDQPTNNMTIDEVMKFLNEVHQEKIPFYGGKTVWARVKRLGYDIATGLLEFVAASPVLALFVLGIPIGVVSLLIYLICCLEPASDSVDFEDDEDNRFGNMVSSHPLTEGPDGPRFHGDSKDITQSDKKND